MPKIDIKSAISTENFPLILEALEDKELPIESVKAIYYPLRGNKEVVGQVAMNLSLRTSVYERGKEHSKSMVELLIDIAKNPIDMGARWAVAKNPHTPVEVLCFLANDDVNLVRALVATNPSTPPEVLETFFNDEKIVRDGLSGNPNTPIKLLKILANDSDKMVRIRLTENRAASIDILKGLSSDSNPDVAMAAKVNLEKHL